MNRLDHPSRSDAGFSLVEVVLAIGIVSFAVLSTFLLL
jgi:prepilin-type N-terminal cleavage/methylation domain-containing protein